jgi:hypothetical protein
MASWYQLGVKYLWATISWYKKVDPQEMGTGLSERRNKL